MTRSFPTPAGYREVSPTDLAQIASGLPAIAARLGGPAAALRVTEVSDGNMNAVWLIYGPAGAVIAKQALPYIRVIGTSWPFPVDRITFEHQALTLQTRFAPRYLPEVYDYRPDLGLIFMQALSPHIVLRHGLVAGIPYPRLAADLGDYLARTLFFTSDLHLDTSGKNTIADAFSGNAHLCETTQDVVFTGPYWPAPLNRLTPGQEARAAALRADTDLKLAATRMKHIFATRSEALLHGDLHTGSIMVTGGQTKVIDPEWAFVGPMGFDVGVLIAHLLLGFFSQSGHATPDDDRAAHSAFLLDAVTALWSGFAQGLHHLCQTQPGPLLNPQVLSDADQRAFVDQRLADIYTDSLGFAGAEMIRRIIGISHVEDFEMISDVPSRLACEAQALELSRLLLCERKAAGSINDVAAHARRIATRAALQPDRSRA
ncbi:MAG: S-methyl-5-thioribose kinase [Rhodobacterales bacterium]